MLNKKIIIGLMILLFLTCGVASAFDLFGNGYTYDDIGIGGYHSGVSDHSYIDENGEIVYSYLYSTGGFLEKVPSDLKGSKILIYFYSNDDLVEFNDSNSVTKYCALDIDENNSFHDDSYSLDTFVHSDELINVTNVTIVIVKDGETVYNVTREFSMDNAEKFGENGYNKIGDNANDKSSSSDNSGAVYVASSNSNKFHEPYCSQAKRINDANKITFSSREEAINAGYEPCEICYP